jgi:hypothetical protein
MSFGIATCQHCSGAVNLPLQSPYFWDGFWKYHQWILGFKTILPYMRPSLLDVAIFFCFKLVVFKNVAVVYWVRCPVFLKIYENLKGT